MAKLQFEFFQKGSLPTNERHSDMITFNGIYKRGIFKLMNCMSTKRYPAYFLLTILTQPSNYQITQVRLVRQVRQVFKTKDVSMN
jgi:hypothetical protein